MIPELTDKPSPVPVDFVVKKGLKILDRTSAGIPGPSSVTSTTTGVREQVQQHLLERIGVPEHGRERFEETQLRADAVVRHRGGDATLRRWDPNYTAPA